MPPPAGAPAYVETDHLSIVAHFAPCGRDYLVWLSLVAIAAAWTATAAVVCPPLPLCALSLPWWILAVAVGTESLPHRSLRLTNRLLIVSTRRFGVPHRRRLPLHAITIAGVHRTDRRGTLRTALLITDRRTGHRTRFPLPPTHTPHDNALALGAMYWWVHQLCTPTMRFPCRSNRVHEVAKRAQARHSRYRSSRLPSCAGPPRPEQTQKKEVHRVQ